ncbi:type VII secretion protein EccB [Mycolicibacterium arenosum]|uniref:Type VII secretion protein EccB n=1 Tax=Mycolicibacterium arenosum TaxID=2952157 RepID=A0ABT1LXE1_9MYCO|nr:type VII secretion protein EccB [Mycolicibacterium sp. CAU 1645]MCP9271569.1 type VII secretion protein EccB [Mycolicibacterium sp. CAU 1645]
MPAPVTTRAQVNGYRFVLRRLEHALIRGDSRLIHDPMRGQIRALIVGLVVSVLIAGAAGVLAFFKPTPNMGDAQILLSKSSGALYVRIGDTVHPALNLASARLIAGENAAPKEVDDKFLNAVRRGPAVGAVGAPASIAAGDDMSESSWSVCDTTRTPTTAETAGARSIETAVLANSPDLSAGIRAAAPQEMILARSGADVFLLFDGVRAQIDVADPALSGALHLGGNAIRDVSPSLLNAFPAVAPIVPIVVERTGEPTPYLDPQYRVGAILRTSDSRGDTMYVVLPDGLQPVSATTADIIRYGNPALSAPQIVSPAVTSAAPIVRRLAVDHYPAAAPQIVAADPDRVVCLAWQRSNGAAQATTRLLVGHRLPLPPDAAPVTLATADGSGPGLDGVYLRPGTGEYVRATGVEPGSRATGQLFYVSDTGLRFHVKDLETGAALGATAVKGSDGQPDTPQLAPWPVLALLPPGPQLSQESALVAHDGMAADPAGQPVLPSGGG